MNAGLRKLEQELVMIQQDGYRWVGMLRPVHKEFLRIESRWKARLERHFRNYGIPGTSLPGEAFNSEGRHPTGGNPKEVLVLAFKAYQHRLYGVSLRYLGTETFVGLKLITDKKTNRADQELLRRVAKSALPYLEE